MNDELKWQSDRSLLRRLHYDHPEWNNVQLAQATGRCVQWVRKWLNRLKDSPVDDSAALASASRRRKTLPPPLDPTIVERVLAIRDNPPQNLQRIPGPRAIAYYLARDTILKEKGISPPRSTSTIYAILLKNGKIGRKRERDHKPMVLPPPGEDWQLDFKDSWTVKVGSTGKKAHLVEIFDMLDVGSGWSVANRPREDYNAETAVATVLEVVETVGLPKSVTFDRDPRFVGSHSGRDFPAAFVKMWHCLGVKVNICPPHRPDMNGIVERFHRSIDEECLKVERPATLGEVVEAVNRYQQHYNYERPHQGRACRNQPPRVAFAEIVTRPIPFSINPDGWVERIKGNRYVRRVNSRGVVKLDRYHYYVGRERAGQYVSLEIKADTYEIVVIDAKSLVEVKRMALKGLCRKEMSFEEYKQHIIREARSERRLAQLREVFKTRTAQAVA